ncbi:MAG: YkgJ family cysteine cluster protein, partial [Methanomicrobiales archaeon]|nr:YkgJ family cysteine cluster protein [Methanomicrobiales archaeon]
ANHRICCVVHASRPDLCREYGCWRLLVLDGSGKRVGRIMGTRHLATDDPVLRAFWVDHFGDIQGFDDDRWDRTIITVLENNGYRVLV